MLALLTAMPGFAVAQTDKPPAQNPTGSSSIPEISVPELVSAENSNAVAENSHDKSPQVSGQDRKFVEQAGSAGLAEVQAGDLALHRAAAPAVREFGRWMITDHTAMGDMLAHHAENAGLNVPRGMNEEDNATLSGLQQFQGAEFDLHYIATQVEAHKQAMELFKQEAQSGENPELKSFAQRAQPMLMQHMAEAGELASAPESSTARSAEAAMPPPAAMLDPKAANPALQNTNRAEQKAVNQEGARKIETEGK